MRLLPGQLGGQAVSQRCSLSAPARARRRLTPEDAVPTAARPQTPPALPEPPR